MNFKDLVALYEEWRLVHGKDTPRYISAILEEAKTIHYQDWQKRPTAAGDHEQSWRAFKGKNLEKLVMHIFAEEVEELGLGIVQGNELAGCGRMGSDPEQAGSKAVVGRGFALGGEVRGA